MISKEVILSTKLVAFIHFAEGELRIDYPSIINVFEHEGYIVDWTNFEQILEKRLQSEVVGQYAADNYTKLMIVDGLIKLAGHLHIPPKTLNLSREKQIREREEPKSIEDLLPGDRAALERFIHKRNSTKS